MDWASGSSHGKAGLQAGSSPQKAENTLHYDKHLDQKVKVSFFRNPGAADLYMMTFMTLELLRADSSLCPFICLARGATCGGGSATTAVLVHAARR